MQPLFFFDIETRARPDEQLADLIPSFEAPGNYKDKDKIADYVAGQRRKWFADAALSPMTGEVLAIGYLAHGCEPWIEAVGTTHETEAALLAAWSNRVGHSAAMGANYKMAGWNIRDFDVPFIVRRLWFNRIAVPFGLNPTGSSRFHLPPWFVDLRDVWGVGEHQPGGNLAQVGAFLGLGTYQTSGADFARLFADPATRQQAIEHTLTQLSICSGMAERFGVRNW